jgi:hypothetical protein
VTERTKILIDRLSERRGEIKARIDNLREKKAEKKALRKLKERKRSINLVMTAVCEFEGTSPK